MKKILSTLTAITLLAGATAINASAFTPSSYATDLKVYFNGENVYAGSENQPCIMNDRTMVQIRPIFEKLGYTAKYDDATKTATFYGGGDNVPISFTNDSYTVNKLSSEDGSISSSINIDVPATIYSDTFYVPLRAFCDTVSSLSIDWDSATRSVYLNSSYATSKANTASSSDEETKNNSLSGLNNFDAGKLLGQESIVAGMPVPKEILKQYTSGNIAIDEVVKGALYDIDLETSNGMNIYEALKQIKETYSDTAVLNGTMYIYENYAIALTMDNMKYKVIYCPNGSAWAQTKNVPCYEVYACEQMKDLAMEDFPDTDTMGKVIDTNNNIIGTAN